MPRRKKLIPEKMPGHVAIIMDGNGRWAKARGLSRIAGHRAGIRPIRLVVETARKLGLKVLTLFAFSTENRKRPQQEVEAILKLLKAFLRKERKNLIKNNIRLMTIGNIEWFPAPIINEIKKTIFATANNTSLTLVLALNYGGRMDIIQACRRISEEIESKRLNPSDLTEEVFSSYLYTAGLPDPDLLIRTSSEYRLSNFLLWQLSYSELWITPVLWPDFSKKHFLEALYAYQNRQRRFGLVLNA